MHERPTDRSRDRLQQAAAQRGLNGWALTALVDGIDSNGEPIYWHEYQHLDGRRAEAWPDGRCSDPELMQLLEAQALEAKPPRPSRRLRMAAAIAGWMTGRRR